jgi:hypothetical protein
MNRVPIAPPEISAAEERVLRDRAIFELLNKHDTKIGVMETHALTVAQQVAELTVGMHLLRKEIPTLMAAGLMQAVSDPGLWEAAGKAMHGQAKSAAGSWLFGGLKAALVRLSWVAALVFVLYTVGGLPAVTAWLRSQHP